MIMTAILSAMAMTAPAPCFYSWFSPETANACMEYAVNGEYAPHLDYNSDGVLSAVDAVAIYKRYALNCENGNAYTFTDVDVMAVVEENVNPAMYSDYFYYEIDFVDGVPCRCYDFTAETVTEVHVYCELNDTIFQFTASIDPYRERVSVID